MRDEAFYRALVEGMNDGVLTRDAAGIITYASPRFRDMLGYNAEELVSTRSEFVLPPEQRERWARVLAAAAEGPQRFEHDLIGKDGHRVSVAVSRRPVFDALGAFQGSVALVSNITEERRASLLLQEVAEATAPHTGEEFFRTAVRFLALALRCKLVLVAECADYPTTRVRTLAKWHEDRLAENSEYDLAGTPCEEAVKGGKAFCCPSAVESRFSAERGSGLDGYVGIPCFDSSGRVIGHVALFDDKPIDEKLAEHPMLRIVCSRAEAELRRKRADDTMLLIGRAVAPLSGEVFFRTLIEQLVQTFGFRQAFISECLDSPPTRVRTVAYWDHTGLRENTEFDLAGLPCEITIGEARPYFVPDRLDALYPAEAGRGRVSYLGLPIFAADRKRVVGHLAFFDDRPRAGNVLDSPAFRILASRAGVELLRKRAEDELRASEAKYRLLVENQTDLLVKLDRQGRYVFVSPSFCRCFGKTEAQLLGRPFELEVNPLDREAFTQAYAAVLVPPYRSHREARVLTSKGWQWLAWECSGILDERGEAVVEIIASGREITERKRAEEQARQHLQQLAHVTRVASMGEMASAIAHEINQPLTAITTYSQACMRLLRSGRASLDEIADTMDRVAARAERASEIIRRLRSFVRKENAQLIPVQINFLVNEIVRFAQPDARQSGVEITTDLADGLPAVMADSIQIEQVLLNLVRNAIDAINGAGAERREVRVATRRGPEDTVEAYVEDSGPGFDDAAAEQLFEPFFTTKAEGMGIGLSISRSIVEAHQGRIWATAARGRGASFHLVLPAAAREQHVR